MCCEVSTKCRCICLFIGIVFVLVGMVGLVYFGVNVARPYLDTIKFEEADCAVIHVTDRGFITCDCGKDCQSTLPCKQVLVAYSSGTHKGNSSLYADGATVSDYSDIKCSSYICRRDSSENVQFIDSFIETHGRIGKKGPCFYNPEKSDEAILSKISLLSLLLSMCIPGGLFIIGITMTVICCKNC